VLAWAQHVGAAIQAFFNRRRWRPVYERMSACAPRRHGALRPASDKPSSGWDRPSLTCQQMLCGNRSFSEQHFHQLVPAGLVDRLDPSEARSPKRGRDLTHHCVFLVQCTINMAHCNSKGNEGYASICYESALLIVATFTTLRFFDFDFRHCHIALQHLAIYEKPSSDHVGRRKLFCKPRSKILNQRSGVASGNPQQ
jgi:hypothetical protein